MNGFEILNVITKDAVSCKYLGGLMAINRLHFKPTSRIFYICNTDLWENKGKHWIVMYYINNNFEYFDPLGNKPDILFSNFMKQYAKRIIFNEKPVQPLNSSTCGEYCIFFSAMRSRDVNFGDIIKYMQYDQIVLDFVNDLTCLH
jgi:hypothetical protein